MFQDKEAAVLGNILEYILSERERLGLQAPSPNNGLAAAARETAFWFAGEDHFDDKISEYLRQRFVEQTGNVHGSWFLQLTYGRDLWPAETEPAVIASDLIGRVGGLSRITSTPALDYLGIGTCFAIFDEAGNPTDGSSGKPRSFGYAVVVAYATDGNSAIVDQINDRRKSVGVPPLEISAPLREMARNFITWSSADEVRQALMTEAERHRYLEEGWRARLSYSGSYAMYPSGSGDPVTEPEMAEIVAAQLVEEWPVLLRPDWQDIGIATGVKTAPELGGPNFVAEYVIGWRIPFDAERPSHFPPPNDEHGNLVYPADANAQRSGGDDIEALLGPVYLTPPPKPRRRGWWPFRRG